MEKCTPRKLGTTKKCLVCGNFPKEIRKVESAKIREQNLKDLLLKYGGINIESGIVCRNCFLKLDNLDKKCHEFYENCQKMPLVQSYDAKGWHLLLLSKKDLKREASETVLLSRHIHACFRRNKESPDVKKMLMC